ncbi:FAD-binding molybdopterin dehydrogenase [Mycolicibacterium canariasense]|uniref:FAD-binding molybdopterin dehydrogenase n=1 Tax=Mycolicibacterium canariasense TaxID=228230 RepID=A0A117I9N0_MYCCR|nr:xanthine dehydrogenase family protein subunit M [Mycolicibacterium canariasense]MCV7209406.1 xanthine dehydrogenase family protein subunit M [Mycolicibacterium canariasense]ORV05780.1 molybdopterin dehydrogenase [Mycolicibacterium canariasense]GAS95058.1 FAD-binding molybdopterin dehydrogenase [Mycolicibacterium canariasense]
MKTFAFRHAVSVPDAINEAATGARYFAGGTNLLDLMKTGVEAPDALIDIRRIGLDTITATPGGGVRIGAGVTNSAVANHRLIRTRYPVLSQAILSGATTQIRNMATAGGNLVQRTRCPYFMDPAFAQCNKRSPGSGCAAVGGFNREHALFGASAHCVAVHPSDMAVALAILDAVVRLRGPAGERTLPIAEFFALPGDRPDRDNTKAADELITAIELPPTPFADASWYLKVRDRHSYAFALVSVAAGVQLKDGVIASAAIALGGVAAKPWRSPEAEAVLRGERPATAVFRHAAELLMAGAEPLSQNAFKVDLGKHSVVRALQHACGVNDE